MIEPIVITAEPVHGEHAQPKSYITFWMKPEQGSVLDWDVHISRGIREAETTVKQLQSHGVGQFFTYELGARINHLSVSVQP